MNIPQDLLKAISELGYAACFIGDSQRAETIMKGVEAVAQPQPAVHIGLAVSKMYAGQLTEAKKILETIINANPNHSTAKCFLGITLNMMGKKEEAQKQFAFVSEHGDENEIEIARSYL